MALLTWALIFAVIALVAGVFGFGGVASAAAGVARILFFIAIVIFLDLPDHRTPLAPRSLVDGTLHRQGSASGRAGDLAFS